MGSFIKLSNFPKILPYIDLFKEGLAITSLLAFFTVVVGFVLALVLALMRMSNFRPFLMLAHAFPKTFGFFEKDHEGNKLDSGFLYHLGRFNPISFLSTAYVEVMRSTPVLVQLWIIYYGVFGALFTLPRIKILGFISLNRFLPAAITLGLNSGAYLCEIIRSGLQSVEGGQTEAARSLGLKQAQTLQFIVLPQALKNILPAIANEFVVIIKESAIAYTVGVSDIMAAVNAIKSANFIVMEPLLVATAIYFCLCFPTSKLIAYVERRMRRGDIR